jgi:peptide/nickel transport system permease protein
MLRLVVRRVLIGIPLILIISFLVFVLIDFAPGDAATTLAGDNPTPERIEAVRQQLHLDDPLVVRYASWVGDAVQGDFGKSFQTTEPVRPLIFKSFWVTGSLVSVALVMTLILSTILGIVAALRPGKLIDRGVTVLSSFAVAVPSFWLGLILVYAFAINRRWFPALGYHKLSEGFWSYQHGWLRSLILPATALALVPAAELTLQLKGALIETLNKDYVMAARAKGMSGVTLVGKHAMKNAAIPVITVLGYRVAQLMGGTVIIETLFSMRGIGSLAFVSAQSKNIPVLLGLVVMTTLIVLIVNVLVDISYGYFNPKVRT